MCLVSIARTVSGLWFNSVRAECFVFGYIQRGVFGFTSRGLMMCVNSIRPNRDFDVGSTHLLFLIRVDCFVLNSILMGALYRCFGHPFCPICSNIVLCFRRNLFDKIHRKT